MNLSTTVSAAVISALGDPYTVGANTFKAIIDLNVDIYDEDGAVSEVANVAFILVDDLPAHAHGTAMTDVTTSQVYKLQRTISNDGVVRGIEVIK